MSAADRSVLHLNLDDAWDIAAGLPTIDLREWGPRLRFSAPAREIERFAVERARELAPFLVYGSGDFHHLTAIWLRRLSRLTTVISFDNHPDWDIRPPKWACGGWVNRALDLAQIDKVSVWGCGNFECWWPMRVFGNNLAEQSGRLEVHPWADDRSAKEQRRLGAILRSNWREQFEQFVRRVGDAEVYVTIDLDCLRPEEAATNWESGRFTVEDVRWALDLLNNNCRIVAGDICGAWSFPRYARRKQRFASDMDTPRINLPGVDEIRGRNENALRQLLPVLSH
jgi:arginase family enzyme